MNDEATPRVVPTLDKGSVAAARWSSPLGYA